MKEFYIEVEGFDSLHDYYSTEKYISRIDSEEKAIEYAKVMFLSEHEDCCEKDLTVDLYFKEID